jgi:hypothetical protein
LHQQTESTDRKKNKMTPMSPSMSATNSVQGHSHDAIRLMMSAWEEGTEAGISPETMAFAALYTGLSDLVGAIGEDQVAVLMERLAKRVRGGEFSFGATKQ